MKLITGVAQVQSYKRLTSCINEHNIYVLHGKQSKPSVVRDMKLQQTTMEGVHVIIVNLILIREKRGKA